MSTKIQAALERAEKARSAMNDYRSAGDEGADEKAFGHLEAEWFAARDALSIEVEIALGVPPARLAVILA